MAEKTIALKGSVPVNKHTLIGPVDPNERIEVTIKLRRKTEEGLPTIKEFLAGKRGVGITRQELGERYGASQKDADAVQQWAALRGLSVQRVDLGRRQMHLVGSADAMSRAFGVKLSMYKHSRTGADFRCPKGEIHIPKQLVPIIKGVFGLSNMPVAVRHSIRFARRINADPKQQNPGSLYPNEVAKLYNFPPTQGAGQSVAVLEFGGGFDQTVLRDYFTQYIGLTTPPTVNAVPVLGQQPDVNDAGVTGEVYLDIEVIGGMAPKTRIDVYFAPWSGEGYLNAIDQAVHNDDYAAISISYGIDEEQQGSAGNPGWTMLHDNVDESFRDATAVGIPVFVSSGDQGSSSKRVMVSGNVLTGYSPTAHAAYPASSPYATAVGGTMLYAKNGVINEEVVWNELGDLQHGKYYFGGATGGGVSGRYTVPSYQSNAGVTPQSVDPGSAKGRGVPDVAGNAGASTGYLVSQPPGSPQPIGAVGGTSAAAPMWAALMSCIRETLEQRFNGKVPVFFFNDFVYANGKTTAFRDIVGGRQFSYQVGSDGYLVPVPGAFTATGNNRSTQADGYYAAKGYDLCTGWGSPNGAELLKQLQAWLVAQPGAQSKKGTSKPTRKKRSKR